MPKINLDHTLTTFVVEETLKASPNAIHELLGASLSDHFVLTSSGAEAVNHVIFATYLDVTRKTGKNHFLVSSNCETPSLFATERLTQLGCNYNKVPLSKNGNISLDSLISCITPRTALFSLVLVDGLTGVIQPLDEIQALCHERGILLHVDVTHILGKGHFSMSAIHADFVTFNGPPLHAPKGTGGLFIKSKHQISSLILGGVSEQAFRGGEINEELLSALQRACQLNLEHKDFISTEIALLKEDFETKICQDTDATVLFHEEMRAPHISCIHFPKVSSDAMHYLLHKKQLTSNVGGGYFQPLKDNEALSFALCYKTTKEELDVAATLIKNTYTHLRKCSADL